jgi:hypothetical protein
VLGLKFRPIENSLFTKNFRPSCFDLHVMASYGVPGFAALTAAATGFNSSGFAGWVSAAVAKAFLFALLSCARSSG